MRDRILMHVIWTTRDRERLINKSVADFLCGFLPVVCRQERARLIEFGAVQSHVHLIVALHPTTAIPRLLQRMKGGSSVVVNRSRWSRTPLKWAKGYNIQSVGSRGLEVALEYVRNQHLKHPDEVLEGWQYGCRFTDTSRAAASSREGAPPQNS